MGKHVISLSLSENGIDKAIRELEAYKQDLIRKTEILRQRIAERIKEEAENGFNGAIVDDIINGTPKQADVTVEWHDNGNLSVVVAHGEDAVWVEFGAGVYHNGSLGSSPHPHGVDLGMIIGGYGEGRGRQKTWYYRDKESQELYKTHGTPALMPMSQAVNTVINDIVSIAREVFG